MNDEYNSVMWFAWRVIYLVLGAWICGIILILLSWYGG